METLPEVAELGFRGMHYIDVVTATPARECFDPKHPINKRQSCEYFDKLFEKTVETTYSDSSVVTVDYNKKTYSLRKGNL